MLPIYCISVKRPWLDSFLWINTGKNVKIDQLISLFFVKKIIFESFFNELKSNYRVKNYK